MNIIILSAILISISLSVAAQLFLKNGMSNEHVQKALAENLPSALIAISTNIFIILGLASYVASMGAWLYVLSKMEVSKAYPFVGLGFIGTMICAYWLLNEPLNPYKIIGTVFISVGVYLVSKS
ncbi:multidrug efflux SMR transporter [Paraglaciecola sp. L3A3]|uniref:DMT family transporter n=1 Tax=Paraglaciecola sp. L3A3 TaxID=2686358 RepID=UPI00131E4C5C|nr:EamA family transporter [Paraglaciecola sp. L3A3]